MSGPQHLPRSTRRPGPVRDPHRRVGDDERRAAADVLGQAWSLGYVQQDELDDRIERVLSAVTRADVGAVLADLPLERLRRADPRRREARRRAARVALRLHAVAAVVVSVVVVAVWAAVALGAGVWFPWFVFPVVGAGTGLVCHLGVVRLCAARPDARRGLAPVALLR